MDPTQLVMEHFEWVTGALVALVGVLAFTGVGFFRPAIDMVKSFLDVLKKPFEGLFEFLFGKEGLGQDVLKGVGIVLKPLGAIFVLLESAILAPIQIGKGIKAVAEESFKSEKARSGIAGVTFVTAMVAVGLAAFTAFRLIVHYVPM